MATRSILAALLSLGLAAATADAGQADTDASPLLWSRGDKAVGTDADTLELGEKQDETDEESKRFDSGSLVTQSLAAVLVILVLGAAAIFVVKRVLPRIGIAQGRRINVLETVYLGSRRSLHMVQVGDRTLLVGDTRERLGLLADLTGSVETDESPQSAPVQRRKPAAFVMPVACPEENS